MISLPVSKIMESEISHIPVMAEEVGNLLVWREEGVYVDGTVGEGGHTKFLLERFPRIRIVGIDWDGEILDIARRRLWEFGERVILIEGNFSDLPGLLRKLGMEKVEGVLLDLGLSSFHLEKSGRGFSFSREDFLDMRYSSRIPRKAWDIVNFCSREELESIFLHFGEEKRARDISRWIVQEREKGRINTASELRDIINRRIKKRGRIDPSTRVFQALRIAVNRELENLKIFLEELPYTLRAMGRVVIISYHSLEDRIVKKKFKEWSEQGIFEVLTPQPLTPSPVEIAVNPRSRSAKLRGARLIERMD